MCIRRTTSREFSAQLVTPVVFTCATWSPELPVLGKLRRMAWFFQTARWEQGTENRYPIAIRYKYVVYVLLLFKVAVLFSLYRTFFREFLCQHLPTSLVRSPGSFENSPMESPSEAVATATNPELPGGFMCWGSGNFNGHVCCTNLLLTSISFRRIKSAV